MKFQPLKAARVAWPLGLFLAATAAAALRPPRPVVPVQMDDWYAPEDGATCVDGYHLDVQVSCADVFNGDDPHVRVVCHADDAPHDGDDPCGAVCVRALDGGVR